jgi:hypothetical protein
MIHTSRVDVQTRLKVACIERLPSSSKYASKDPRVRYRDVEFLRLQDEFHREVRRKRLKPHQLPEFLMARPDRAVRHDQPSRLLRTPAGGLLLGLSLRLSEVMDSAVRTMAATAS